LAVVAARLEQQASKFATVVAAVSIATIISAAAGSATKISVTAPLVATAAIAAAGRNCFKSWSYSVSTEELGGSPVALETKGHSKLTVTITSIAFVVCVASLTLFAAISTVGSKGSH
jgi:hypothetical protein